MLTDPTFLPHLECSATVEAGLREQLATAQRIMRLAHLSKKLELPGEQAAAQAAAAGQQGKQQLQAAGGQEQEQEQGAAAGEPAAADRGADAPPSSTDDDSDAVLAELGLPPGSGGQRLLAAFLRRMNSAVLDRAALERERLRLAAENQMLQAVVAAVQAGAVDGPLSTLLVVNSRLQQELGGAAAQRRALSRASGDRGSTASTQQQP